MLLVAAMAAGVFVDVTGSLRGSADQTSQQSESQVTSRLTVINTVGTDVTDTVDEIAITVKPASGSDDIDVGSTTVQWLGPSGVTDLTLGSTADAVRFSMTAAQDDDGSIADDGILNAPGDRATLRFDAAAIEGGLAPGDTATLRLTTATGGTTTVRVVVPDPLSPTSSLAL